MIEITAWAEDFAQKLEGAFGPRLRFVGYQGSYGRGEATAESDIDMVTVLDAVGVEELSRYRELVRGMPSGELACGFICGAGELKKWPRFDGVSLLVDTIPVRGDLRELLPPLTRRDAWDALQVGASALYHGACHAWLYGSDPKEALPGLGKAAFFCLRSWLLCRHQPLVNRKAAMLPLLSSREQGFLRAADPAWVAALGPQDVEGLYRGMIGWCQEQLQAVEPQGLQKLAL